MSDFLHGERAGSKKKEGKNTQLSSRPESFLLICRTVQIQIHGLKQQVEIVQCIYADVSESVLKNSWNKLYIITFRSQGSRGHRGQ